jgi:hypothetical protein
MSSKNLCHLRGNYTHLDRRFNSAMIESVGNLGGWFWLHEYSDLMLLTHSAQWTSRQKKIGVGEGALNSTR